MTFAKNLGAWPLTPSEYISLDPANRAWLPAEMTLVITTALMKLPATLLPAIMKTIVKGEVWLSFEAKPSYVYGTFKPMIKIDRM